MRILKSVSNTIKKITKRITDDQLWPYATQASFYVIMAFFPFIMFFLTLLQFLPFTQNELVDGMYYLIPSAVGRYLVPIIDEAYQSSSGTLLSITIVTFLWPASKGIVAVKDGLNRVYKADENRWYIRLLSIGYIIVFAVSIILLLTFYVLGNEIGMFLESRFPVLAGIPDSILSVRFIVSAAFLTLVFMFIYKLLPNRKSSLVKEFPGAVLAALGWIFFSYLFSYYIDNLSNMTATYGSLTTIVLCMVWLEFCMFILFMGAELNDFFAGKTFRRLIHRLFKRKASDDGAESENNVENITEGNA